MPEPKHDEALVNRYLERISALSVSAFDGADVSGELGELAREAASRSGADTDTLSVLASRLRERADAADREGQPLVRNTFALAASLIASQ